MRILFLAHEANSGNLALTSAMMSEMISRGWWEMGTKMSSFCSITPRTYALNCLALSVLAVYGEGETRPLVGAYGSGRWSDSSSSDRSISIMYCVVLLDPAPTGFTRLGWTSEAGRDAGMYVPVAPTVGRLVTVCWLNSELTSESFS